MASHKIGILVNINTMNKKHLITLFNAQTMLTQLPFYLIAVVNLNSIIHYLYFFCFQALLVFFLFYFYIWCTPYYLF